jgi:hypothetical protein
MKKTLSLFLLMLTLLISACAPRLTPTPQSTQPAAPAQVQTATSEPNTAEPTTAPPQSAATPQSAAATASATVEEPAVQSQTYTNSTFGLSFEYPLGWFGPDEYVSDQVLRVAVGSDVVYPYGTDRMEQLYTLEDSYYVVIQYSQNDQNQVWTDTYQSLASLQDGESVSDARSLVIRVRQVNLGRFEGIEYITTLSETAQTEPVYIRQVILFDEQSNVISIMGAPNNVTVSSETGWRTAYQSVDEANLEIFHQIVESIVVE